MVNNRLWAYTLLLSGSLLTAVWIMSLQWSWPWRDLWSAADGLPLEALAVQSQTLPRMAAAWLAGGASALATVLMQQILRNPLASDSTLAVSGGAQTALLAATVFAPSSLLHGTSAVAFGGAAAALAVVLYLSARRELLPLTVVLAGLVLSLYLGAVSGALTLFYSEETRGVMLWGSGSLIQDGWTAVGNLLWRTAAAAVGIAVLLKPMALMSLGDVQAAALGVPVRRIRVAVLALAAFLSANVVAEVGMMGFVGLAAAAWVRQSGVRTVGRQSAAAWLCGGMMLSLTDNLLMLMKHYYGLDWPAGAVSALIGAPLLLWLMARTPSRPVFQAAAPMQKTVVVLRFGYWPLLFAVVAAAALLIGRDNGGWYLSADSFLWSLRWPRVLTAAAAGVLLATAGVLLQRLTQNPMAGPEVLGISSGTALGAMAAVLCWDVAAGSTVFWLAGTLAAWLTLMLILLLNRKNGLMPEKVLLTGLAVAALADSALRVWAAGGDLRIQQLLVWLSGSTYQAQGASAVWLGATALAAWGGLWPLSRWLGLLGVGGTVAQAAGVNVKAARCLLVSAAAVMTAVATLLVGPLSFVGLLAPHMAQMLGARLPRQQLWTAGWLGAAVMTLADWLGRQAVFPYEIPAGLTATLLGGAYFLWLMRRM